MLDYDYYDTPLTLYNISKYMLGYNKLVPEVHGIWCDKLEQQRLKHKRILKLKPRGTYKTTIYTVGQAIELLMQDWLANNCEFDKRILIASATETLATQILSEIEQHFQYNPNLRAFFGYDPVRAANSGYMTLWPKSIHKEPTIKAIGSGTAIVSEHYDIIFCDDVVNAEDRESQAKRDKNWRWYQDVISILEPDGYLGVWGTRWHFDDVYNHIFKINPDLEPEDKYTIEVEAAIDDATGKTLFPSILSDSKIRSLKVEKGLVEFYAQYLNKCIPLETQLFPLENMKFYPEYGPKSTDLFKGYHKTLVYCDPSLGKSEKGDYAIVIVGTLWDKRLHVRDVFLNNRTTPAKVAKITEQMLDKYDVSSLILEANGFQTLYSKYFHELDIPVTEYRNTKNKEVRIEGLEPYVTSGKVLFREDWQQAYPLFIEQLNMYPAVDHDDSPDGLEAITKIAFGKQTGKFSPTGLVSGIQRMNKVIAPVHPDYPGRPWRKV